MCSAGAEHTETRQNCVPRETIGIILVKQVP